MGQKFSLPPSIDGNTARKLLDSHPSATDDLWHAFEDSIPPLTSSQTLQLVAKYHSEPEISRWALRSRLDAMRLAPPRA